MVWSSPLNVLVLTFWAITMMSISSTPLQQEVHVEKLDVHRTHTPRCEVKKIIALWRMHAVMQGWKEVGCED